MSEQETTQTNNTIAGDQAGRDIHKPSYTFSKSQETISYMTQLLCRLKEEQENDIRLTELIDDLEHYSRPFKGDVQGLESKLKDGDLESFVDFALRAKERFYKKLIRYQLFESAQKINVHLLALVESYFENHIVPKIQS